MRGAKYSLLVLLCVINVSAHAAFVGTDLSTLKKIKAHEDGTFKGSNLAAGGTLNTGNTGSLQLTANGLLQYTYHQWIHSISLNYQREQNRDDGLKANHLFLQGQSLYNLDKKQFLFTQLNYTQDKFDGYNYIVNLSAGYGRNIDMPKNMLFSWMAGPGINQYQDVNNVQVTRPSIEGAINYVWDIRSDLQFSENLESIATTANIRTISTTGLTTKLTDDFNLELMFQAIDDDHPPAGKVGFNTITSVQLSYQI
ncbi:MAG: DUF481 domain-containing protein [Gammaproteobacteria bacterium]|nr:DUF481 domain-containing protein [Gammaproteobacteria bacterium]